VAHWLHRIIVGPTPTAEPQAGLDTEIRAGPLAKKIVTKIVEGADPEGQTLYYPSSWNFANGTTAFPADYNYLAKPVKKLINLNLDEFSERLGQECQPFTGRAPPAKALFDPKKVVIISNGRCASSCSLFSITMAKEEGAKTLVFGGKNFVPQAYAGTVGGQSTSFAVIDSDVKTVGLKSDPLAAPDFLTNAVAGITWRLGFGIWNKQEPEEWQSHAADYSFQYTRETVSNPQAIWKAIAAKYL
jgi:hypothetical protein